LKSCSVETTIKLHIVFQGQIFIIDTLGNPEGCSSGAGGYGIAEVAIGIVPVGAIIGARCGIIDMDDCVIQRIAAEGITGNK